VRGSPFRTSVFLILCMWFLPAEQARCQDLEPRRWTPLPVGTSILGAGYAKSSGDIALDPLLLLEDGKADIDSLVISYSHFFKLGKKLARFDAIVPVQHANWTGLLDGSPASVTREGIADPKFRLSINLLGAPVAGPGQSRQGATTQRVNTVVGAAIAVSVPLGNYLEEKLLNLGQNRYIIRPQIGMVHTRGPWSYELTGSTFFFTDNDAFFDGKSRQQDPIFAIQAHLIRVFQPGLWASVSAAYGWGGENTVDDVSKDDSRRDVFFAASVGFPVAGNQSVKFAYIAKRKHASTGSDLDTLAIGWSLRF
jgi:hypothetical protein